MADANGWTLEQAKNGPSEVVRRALDHQPQVVVRGHREEDAVVVIARSDFERLLAPRDLVDFLRASPLAEAIAAGELGDATADDPFARVRDTGRDVALRVAASHLLDTNVLSELVRPVADANVVAWTRARSPLDLWLGVLTLGAIERGSASMALGARRTRREQWSRAELPRRFLGRLLPVDDETALGWGRLAAAGQGAGRPLPVVDGPLLATARVHGLTLVTRNVGDRAGRGVPMYDPWTGVLHPATDGRGAG